MFDRRMWLHRAVVASRYGRPVIEVVTRDTWRVRLGALSAVGLFCVAGAASGRPVRYTITDLGSLPASTICNCFFAEGISQNGTVAGSYFGPHDERRGFVWQNGVMRDIGGAAGDFHDVLAVNDSGTTAGFGSAVAFRAQNGAITNLPGLGGQFSDAQAISNAGVVVGEANTAPDNLEHAVMWVGNTVTDLGTLGGPLSTALGINESGQIVGWAWNAQRHQRAFVWSQATGMTELAPPAPDAQAVQARDINELGQAVGSALVHVNNDPSNPSFTFRGFIWIGGAPVDLGDLGDPDTAGVAPAAINDAGVVVGTVQFGADQGRPFLWEDGAMVDVNTLVDPAQGWTIQSVADINNAGMIAATGLHVDGRRHGLLLTPVPSCAADFDGSGTVNSQDFFAFIDAFFAGAPSADIDQSGQVTSADFFDFLTAFFTGC